MAKQSRPKTYHRWTTEESEKLLAEASKMRELFAQVGKPGADANMTASVLWSQVPGKIGVLVTPEACSMQYRVLTSDEEWAKKRRKEQGIKDQTEETGDLVAEAETNEIQTLGEKVDVLAAKLDEQTMLLRELVNIWASPTTAQQKSDAVKHAAGNSARHSKVA